MFCHLTFHFCPTVIHLWISDELSINKLRLTNGVDTEVLGVVGRGVARQKLVLIFKYIKMSNLLQRERRWSGLGLTLELSTIPVCTVLTGAVNGTSSGLVKVQPDGRI
jgi:hypothetical protein